MTQIALTLLGAFEVIASASGQPVTAFATDKARGLLAYLALQPALAHRRETLAVLFWPETSHPAALTNLRQTFHRLRASLDRAVPGSSDRLFLVTRQTVQLAPTALTVDADRFTTLIDASESHVHATLATCEPCLARLAQAASLYRGELLAGFGLGDAPAFEEWLLLRRAFYQQQALFVLQQLTSAHEARADYEQAHTYASQQVALDPYREEAHRQLMRLLTRRGLTSQALAQYERCCHLLRTEVGVEPDAATVALAAQIRAGQLDRMIRARMTDDTVPSALSDAFPSSPPANSPVTFHNLPAQLTPLVGRTQAVTELCSRLQDRTVRLLTIVGAGGMGKTRLALGVGQTLTHGVDAGHPQFADGIFFVPLASLTVTAAVAPGIAATLGLTLQGDPQQAVIQALRNKQLLLILDNFEHLLDAAVFVVELLQAAPALQILVTSREQVHVRGEHLYLIPPLDYGQASPAVTVDATNSAVACSLSSVQLFTQSAQRGQINFTVDADNVAAVLRICRLVHGLPLALELAAAWVGILPLAEIADVITQRSDFLATNWRDAPERQRSMHAVFAWSWQLLTLPEQQALRQLTVFPGSFTRAAAQAVAGAHLPMLTRLVHKSLVQWDANDCPATGGRYGLHVLLRQFAAETLAQQSAEQMAVQTAHSRFYLTYLAERTLRLVQREPQTAGTEIQIELDNIRQAWHWAAAQGDVAVLARAAYGWWQFCTWRGLISELRQSLAVAIQGVRAGLAGEKALTIAPHDELQRHGQSRKAGLQLLSQLLAIHANLLFAQGVDATMAAQAEEAIALGQIYGSLEGESLGYFVLGRAYQEFEKVADAIAMWQKTIALAQADQQSSTPNVPNVMVRDVARMAYMWLRGGAMALEDYAAGRAYMLQALQICQTMGNVRGELSCLTNLAWNDFVIGDYGAAQQRFEQGFALACTLHHRWAEMATCSGLGEVMRRQGRYMSALAWWERSLTIAGEYSAYDEALIMANLVRLHSYLGDQPGAQRWYNRLLPMLERTKLPKDCQRQALLAAAVKAYYGGDLSRALRYAEQVRQLTGPSEILTVRADVLLVLGHVQAALQQWVAAMASYTDAIACYTKIGNQPEATEAQAGLAQIALAQSDFNQALRWVEAMLPVLAEQPRAGLTTPFATYLTCYRVLAVHQDQRAAAILEQGWRLLLDYAVGISDPGLRYSFLEKVTVHRELQALHELL